MTQEFIDELFDNATEYPGAPLGAGFGIKPVGSDIIYWYYRSDLMDSMEADATITVDPETGVITTENGTKIEPLQWAILLDLGDNGVLRPSFMQQRTSTMPTKRR